jgi:hypothetical protein
MGLEGTRLHRSPSDSAVTGETVPPASSVDINVPVGILAIVASYLFIDESRHESEAQRLDVPGSVTSGIGLLH